MRQINGHVYRDARTREWHIRLDYGKDAAGVRQQPRTPDRFASRRPAEFRLRELLADLNRSARVDPTRRTVAQVAVEWLDGEVRATLRPRTLAWYEMTCRTRIVPHLGDVPIRELDLGAVERWRAAMLDGGVGRRTVNIAILRLKQVCAYAVRARYIGHSPTEGVRLVQEAHREMAVWTAGQAATFLAHTRDHSLRPLWPLALRTGMRQGELAGLRWEDIDLTARKLRVRRSLVRKGGIIDVSDTKGRQARVIDLSAGLCRELRAAQVAQAERRLAAGALWQDGDYVVTTEHGLPVGQLYFNKIFQILRTQAGLPRIRFHDMRHTAATLALLAGVPLHVVSRMLGHADVSTTANIYIHVLDGQGADAAERIEALLGGR